MNLIYKQSIADWYLHILAGFSLKNMSIKKGSMEENNDNVDSQNKDPSIFFRHNISKPDRDIAFASSSSSLVVILHLMIVSSSLMTNGSKAFFSTRKKSKSK